MFFVIKIIKYFSGKEWISRCRLRSSSDSVSGKAFKSLYRKCLTYLQQLTQFQKNLVAFISLLNKICRQLCLYITSPYHYSLFLKYVHLSPTSLRFSWRKNYLTYVIIFNLNNIQRPNGTLVFGSWKFSSWQCWINKQDKIVKV